LAKKDVTLEYKKMVQYFKNNSLSLSLSLSPSSRGAAEPKLRSKNSPVLHGSRSKIILLCAAK
jgi:hypothetical protein